MTSNFVFLQEAFSFFLLIDGNTIQCSIFNNF
jgi:hypothetical protein